jgi:hypothetical protein
VQWDGPNPLPLPNCQLRLDPKQHLQPAVGLTSYAAHHEQSAPRAGLGTGLSGRCGGLEYQVAYMWDKNNKPQLQSACMFHKPTAQRVLKLHCGQDTAAGFCTSTSVQKLPSQSRKGLPTPKLNCCRAALPNTFCLTRPTKATSVELNITLSKRGRPRLR